MTNASQLWDVCAQSIREQVSDGVWNSTFKEARPHGMIDHELVLTVPSLWVKERIEGRYNQLVLEALALGQLAAGVVISLPHECEYMEHDVAKVDDVIGRAWFDVECLERDVKLALVTQDC